jgi:alpha/beta superfamily hydrolase
LEQLMATLPEPKRLVIIEGADHFFAGRLAELRTVIEEWVQDTVIGG